MASFLPGHLGPGRLLPLGSSSFAAANGRRHENSRSDRLRRCASGKGLASAGLSSTPALAAEHLAQEAAWANVAGDGGFVHEAYLRLTGGRLDAGASAEEQQENHESRLGSPTGAHFFAAAAESMRACSWRSPAAKSGVGIWPLGSCRASNSSAPDPADRQLDLIALDEALTELASEDPRKAKLIELRFFAGLPEAEAAGILGISPATAARDWAFARAWLYRKLHQDPRPEKSPEISGIREGRGRLVAADRIGRKGSVDRGQHGSITLQ